jgi:hypothetical protein
VEPAGEEIRIRIKLSLFKRLAENPYRKVSFLPEVKMSFQESISLMAIAVSFLSVFITLYFQYFRGPRVRIVPGEKIGLYYANNYQMNMDIDIILLNEGAQPCIVKSVQCNIISKTKKLTLDWYGFFKVGNETENEATQGIKRFIYFEGAAEMIPLLGYQIEKKKISFVSPEPFKLAEEGDYILELLVHTNIRPKQPNLYRLKFILLTDDLVTLNEKCVGDEHDVVNTILYTKVESI